MSYDTPRFEVRYPVPPVCTAQWGEADWQRWIDANGAKVDREPETLTFPNMGTYRKTGRRNERGEMLYRREG